MEHQSNVTSPSQTDVSRMLVFDRVHEVSGRYAGRDVSEFIATQSTFESCDFTHMKIARACFGAGLERSIYKNCAFDNSEIRASAPGVARFERCTFLNTHFSELNARNVEFVDCIFSGCIDKGYFNGSVNVDGMGDSGQQAIEFSGNDFRDAELIDVGFRLGVDLRKQNLPAGGQYLYIEQVDEFLKNLKELASTVPVDIKKNFDILSKMVERDFHKGQKQLFFNSEGFPLAFRSSFALIRKDLH